MEKDKHISKLFRESGVVHAPEGFTKNVMDRIEAEPERKTYKPLIGKTGRILGILLITVIATLSVFYSSMADPANGSTDGFLNREWQLPSIDFISKLDFLGNFHFQPWIISTIVALFLLVLSDAGLRRRGKFL